MCVCVCVRPVCVWVGYICNSPFVPDFSTFIDGWQEVARELEVKAAASLRADAEVSLDPSLSTHLWRKDGEKGTRRIWPVPCRLPLPLLLSEIIYVLAWECVRYTHTRTNRLIFICIRISTYLFIYIYIHVYIHLYIYIYMDMNIYIFRHIYMST